MTNQFRNVDQIPANAHASQSHVQQLRSENADCDGIALQIKAHFEKCRDLLRQANAAVPKHQWITWLSNNFDSSLELACAYMVDGTDLEAWGRDVRHQVVVPPRGKSLRFSYNRTDGGRALCIEPAYHEGYYYVTLLEWSCDFDSFDSDAKGSRDPVCEDEIWETCERLEGINLIEYGERTESPIKPLAFNRWQFQGHLQQRQPDADQQPPTEQGST